LQTPPDDNPEPQRAPGDAAGFWDRYSGRAGQGGKDATESPGAMDDEPAGDTDGGYTPPPPPPPYADFGAGDFGGSPTHGGGHECLDWCPICRGAELLRAAVPPELQAQFQTVQRDALLMAQAMIAAQLERMRAHQAQRQQQDHPPDEDPDVESIPVD
jgi:hypothetical protein